MGTGSAVGDLQGGRCFDQAQDLRSVGLPVEAYKGLFHEIVCFSLNFLQQLF